MTPFHLIAKPVGPLCNLRCEYCFYLEKEALFRHEKHSDYKMSDQVLEAFIQQYIAAQPEGTREINFSWQGGEPTLLPRSFFEQVLEYQQKYLRPEMTITNALQTNGTLITSDWAQWLAKHNFLVGISIDGDEELHNRYRKDKNGNGTFTQVMAGIEHLKTAGAEFNTLTVVQNHNSLYPKRIYTFLKGIGSQFLQFIPIVEPTEKGLASSRSVFAEQWGRFLNEIFDCWLLANDIGKIYVQLFDVLLGLHAGYPASLCLHGPTCGRAAAIEHDGTIYSCDHFVTPENRLGNILQDDLVACMFQEKQILFGKNKRDALPKICRTCRWLPLCNGGCPKDRLLHQKDGALNYLCKGYAAFYAHTEPFFRAMVSCLQQGVAPAEFRRFFTVPKKTVGRNDLCPCMSGKKYKYCHGSKY